jgi:outer membrane protein OmpA-like peptidoglycan-associated protein
LQPASAVRKSILPLASVLLLSAPLGAQERTFYLDRAQISGAPDDGFMVWRPYLWDKTRLYGMAALGYSHRPLRADTVADDEQTAERIDDPIEGQLITYLSLGAEIAGRVGLNISLPVAVYQFTGADPQFAGVGGGFDVSPVALHDLRLDARVKAYESDNKKLRLGIGGAAWTPTGHPESFTGDRAVTGWLYGSGEYDFGKVLIAGMIGPHFRPLRTISGTDADLALSDELRWAAGVYVPLRDGKIRVGAEVWGTTGLTQADGRDTFLAEKNTDVEWLAQARFALGERERTWVMAGGGTRLSAGYGAPDFRVLASVGHFLTLEDFTPKSPPPKVAIVSDIDDYDKDTDGDGYPDAIDKCPTIKEDGQEPDPTDGCPTGSDRDRDGIPDDADSCPDVPEDKDGVEDSDGCPERDADKDQLLDAEDRCPTEPGPRRPTRPDKHGCPLIDVKEKGDLVLLEGIQFDFGKATIKPVSFAILDDVVTLMKSRPTIRMGIYGHTDSVGKDEDNLRLSKARAASVVEYIAKKGIARRRLESEGFGESQPIAPDTPAGRAKNRRVDFKMLDME